MIINNYWYSTLAEVGVSKVLESGILKSLLSLQALGELIESSASFFALAGFRVTVINGVCDKPPEMVFIS